MAKQFLDYNPLTGETLYFDYVESEDKMILTHSQDVTRSLELAAALRNDTDATARGIKNDMWRYAHVPNTIIVEMQQKHGVDFFDPNDAKKVFALLNTEYKQFKTTDKHHMPK
jgi:hypothetical protein